MNAPMKRFFLLVSILLSALAAACSNGGSSSGPPPPPPVGNFSNASLSGHYAFSMSGREVCGGQGSFFARAGTFFADGAGHITGGLEDVNVCTGILTLQFTGGSYSVSADGRGALNLTNSTGTTNYSITLTTTTQGFVVQTDVNATASGSFQKQNTAAFSDAAIAGGYVFDFSGIDVAGTTVDAASVIGRFDASGGGGIANGLYHANIGGTLSGQQAFPNGAVYALDTNGDGMTYGRGTANIAGLNFAYYIVDATRIKLIGTDFPSAYLGDAFAQTIISPNVGSLNGSFAFLIGGGSVNGPIATAGWFTADGSGNITNVFADENDTGSLAQLPDGTVSGSYTVDSNQLGGGTLTWTDTNAGTFAFIFYLISPTQAVFQEIDSNIVSDGVVRAQTTSPITSASLAGDYSFTWNGVILARDEVDFTGQFKLTAASPSTFTGALDYNDFGAGTLFFDVVTNGSLTLNSDPTTFNDFTANVLTSPSATLKFTAYVVDQNTVYVVGVDSSPVIAGTLARQP